MLGWIIGALLVGAAVCYVVGAITKENTKEQMAANGIRNAFVKKIDTCKNQITLEDMNSDRTITIEGDSISSEIYRGQAIYA